MNFIIKTIIKKVFQKYLNLQEELNVQSGQITLPYGKINHKQINKKLEPFGIQISQSIYKNLSISIPITEIVSKPIKISIQRFQVLIGKSKKPKQENQEGKQQNLKEKKQIIESNEKIVIEEQVDKYSKSLSPGKQEVSSGYVKNMVNRLLYNMEILFQKVVIKMQKDEESQKQGLSKYLEDVEFEIINLHLRNSLVLLQANIIKKIFNLQQILIRHKFAELIIKDFNICLDYNNKNFNIMAILGSIFLNIKKIPHDEIQKIVKKLNKPERRRSNRQLQQENTKNQSQNENKPKQKSIDLDIYVKINQSNFQIQNIVSLKGEMVELKYKNLHHISRQQHISKEKTIEIEALFKNLYIVHLNDQPFQEKDFLIVRYLPWCTEVKTFSEYEDNILKSALLKFSCNQSHRKEPVKSYDYKKNEGDISSSTSFQGQCEEVLLNDYIKREMKIHVYYLDVVIDFEVVKKVIEKILKDKQLKALFRILTQTTQKNNQPKNQQTSTQQTKQKSQKVEILADILVYRLMVNVRLINQFGFKIYGSFKGDYSNNLKNSETGSLTDSAVFGRSSVQSATTSQHAASHIGRHTHKKKVSIKQTQSKASLTQNQKEKMSLNNTVELKRSNKIYENQSNFNKIVERIHLEVIQLCLECKNYIIIDSGKLELTFNKNLVNLQSEIVIGGTSLNTELSIKLITDIIKLVPVIQKQVKLISADFDAFFNFGNINQNLSSENTIIEQNTSKLQKKKEKISIYLKLNELNLKFGSLIKKPSYELRERITRKEEFVWIILIEINNVLFGTKSFNSFKANFETMIYLTSPQTLHKTSITKNHVEFKIKKNRNNQIEVLLNNDLQLDLNEDNVQIIAKYVGSIGQNMQNDTQTTINSQKLCDNDCCFIEFYNSLEKDVKIIQTNEYEISQDSINLQEFQQSTKLAGEDSRRMQKKTNEIDRQSSEMLFLLNEYCITIEIDLCKSYPVSLEFKPLRISNPRRDNLKYFYEFEEILRFQDNEKMENKYVVHFLLNSIGKIEKIILKHNVSLLTYGNVVTISHENSRLYAYSNIVLKNLDEKITDDQVFNIFRIQNHIKSNQIVHCKDSDVNFEFLLDLNEESKSINLLKGDDELSSQKLKVSGLLLRSPNSKIQNSLYSLFGIYKERYERNQTQLANPLITRLLQSYLYQIKHLQTYYFVELPFLIIQNNLSCAVKLDIFDKKTQTLKSIKFDSKQKKSIHPGSFGHEENQTLFDFYNKQFTIKIKMISKKKPSSSNNQYPEEQIFYESQEHYFNTFFMVEHDFETLITLKSNQKYQFDKKYLFLKEELMLKTKVLKLQPSCRIVNKTNFNFGFKFRRGQSGLGSQIKSPKKIALQNVSETKNQNLTKYVILHDEQQNNHILCNSNSQIDIINQFRPNDVLEILFNNMQQTRIQVPEQTTKQGNILILSFNFAQKDKNLDSNVEKSQKHCHLLFRLRSKTVDNHQFVILENFITFKNLSPEKISLSLEPEKVIKEDQEVIFPLPPTINNKFNNRVILLNNIQQIQSLYEELFSFGFPTKSLKSSKGLKNQISENRSISYYLLVKKSQDHQYQKIALQELLYSKNNVKQVNLGSKGIKLFSLLKDIKNGIIRLFFLEKLFNPNINYLLFNNTSAKNFLISNDSSEYTHHFVKSSSQKSNIFDNTNDENEEESPQKIFIQKNTFSTLSNKDDFELFLCDENGKHLQKSTKANLEKEGLQMDFHTTGNLQLIDILDIKKSKQKQGKQGAKETKISIKTRLVSLNINFYNKLFLNFSISNISLRLLEDNKVDCLIQDISLKNCLSNQHILRIPEQSYVLFEGKTVGNEQKSSFILIKNLFVKCKNIILNLQKDLSYRIISLCKNLLPESTKNEDKVLLRKYFDNEGIKMLFESIEANQSLDKLKNYLKQKLFLVKNIYLHEIHLSLSLDLENNNFSNVMVIPHYELVNSFMREKNLLKEIGEYYKTNVLAKLPKLSFVFQNIKNPVNLFRTMVKVSNALSEKIELKNVLTFDHDEIPENDLQFSLQRWNLIHRRNFSQTDETDKNHPTPEQLLTFLCKNETYYLVSNKSFVVISLNPRNIPKQTEETYIYYQSNSEESVGSKMNRKWIRTYENAMMKVVPLKDLEKVKLIRNKKYSELVIQFKGNTAFNICDQYEKCSQLINTINSIVM